MPNELLILKLLVIFKQNIKIKKRESLLEKANLSSVYTLILKILSL